MFVYREEKGWCISITGASGQVGEFVPVLDYVNRLHSFFKIQGSPYGPDVLMDVGSIPGLVEAINKKAASKKARKPAKRKKR
jgi:hypothetical protein